MGKVIDFFCHNSFDPYGATIVNIVNLNDGYLEASHDLIQWMFPLHEPSNFNVDAPLIDEDSAAFLRSSLTAQANMKSAILRFAKFLGFAHDGEKFIQSENFAERFHNWGGQYNHNHLRITRVIRSLRLFGLQDLAEQFHAAVISANSQASPNAKRYWQLALTDPIFETLRK